MELLRAVIFDIDGVLIDSLSNHLKFCTEEAKTLKLDIKIPDVDGFRMLVRGGIKVSPMKEFFRAVGFPTDKIEQANEDYKEKFAGTYPSSLFSGVPEMVNTLHGAGIKVGLVTSNVKENVQGVLGSLLEKFEPSSIFFLEEGKSKAEQIAKAVQNINIPLSQTVFVGDQPADAVAAKTAGCKFLGVTYGWGISAGEQSFETADSVLAVPMGAYRVAIEFSSDVQLTYAWNWFSYHADQRTRMFNYMFVGLGLFATALVGDSG